MSEVQTNIFTGGLNLDSDISFIPKESYRYAENIRIITDDQGTQGVLQDIEGIIEIATDTYIKKDETVIATCTIDKYGVIITVDSNNITRIYRVDNYDQETINLTVLVKGNLGITKDSRVKIIGNYEGVDNIKIYFVDGINPLRMLNIFEDKYNPENNNTTYIDNVGNIREPDVLNATPSALLEPPTFIDFGTGYLQAGKVQYCYELFNVRGNSTNISPCCNLIPLSQSNVSSWSKDYEGSEKDTNTNKSVKISFNLQSTINGIKYSELYDSFRVYRIHYADNTEQPTITIVGESYINSNDSTITFEDNGSNNLSSVSLEVFNALQNYQFIPKTLDSKDNRLFVANIQQNDWDVDFDARAYRCTKDGRLVLQSISTQELDIQLPEYGSTEEYNILSGIDSYHDCINPYNRHQGSITDNEDFEYSNIKVNGSRVLGGSGLNVSYRFIYNTIDLDRMGNIASTGTTNRLSEYADINIGPSIIDKYIFRYLDNPEDIIEQNTNIDKPVVNNYASPYLSTTTVGYQRDEIYRFGIVLYNTKGIASPVHWIGDIRMPHPTLYKAFYADSTLNGRCLGIQFTIKNLPSDVIAYEIVRCDRTENDRTIITQGILSTIVRSKYKFLNDDQSLDTQYTPTVPLNYSSGGYALLKIREAGVPIYEQEEWAQVDPDTVNKRLSVLISPEIDYMQDTIKDMVSNSYVEPIYFVHGESYNSDTIASTLVQGKQLFIVPYMTNEGHSGNRMATSEITGSWSNKYGGLILSTRNTVGGITNLISKKYILHDTNIIPRQQYQISNEVIHPTLMSGNAILHKMSYYTQIDGVNYLNMGITQNWDNNYSQSVTKGSYFGECLIISGDQLINIPRSAYAYNQTTANANSTIINRLVSQNLPAYFDVPVVNIKRNIIPYGGNSYYNRTNSIYISTGSYVRVLDKISINNVFGGDTYLSILDHRTCCPFPDINDEQHYDEDLRRLLISCSDYIPFESTINMQLNYGQNTSKTGDINYTDVYLGTTIEQGNIGSYHVQDKPYYAYNDAYSANSTAKLYVTTGMYDIQNQYINNRIISSQLKTNNEIDDSWLKFNVADYLDVDGKYGSITNLLTHNNRLYFWQDNALGVASINERSLVTDNNMNEVVLGTGGILTRYDYITTYNGDSVVNDYSITTTDNGIYWYDISKNELLVMSDRLHKLSKEKQIQTFLNDNPKQQVLTTAYNNKYNELQMCFKNYNIVYSERTQQYTSFFTYIPDKVLQFKDQLIYIKDNKFTKNSKDSLQTVQSKVTIVINDNILQTKVFDNVFFHGNFTDIKSMLSNVAFTTKTQTGTILEDYIKGGYAIDIREDTYRFAIGRENNPKDEDSYAGRLRGKYLICDYTILCNNKKHFNLPGINTTYRYSLV